MLNLFRIASVGGYAMNSIDLSPLYRSSIGYDQLANMLNKTFSADAAGSDYPPYNIEVLDENNYALTLAVAGFEKTDVDIHVEQGVLTVKGDKSGVEPRQYLHRGITNSTFERKFNLADYVEVTGAIMRNGLLTINLVKEIPEEMKPRSIAITTLANSGETAITETNTIENKADADAAANSNSNAA
jgi:molecular chaperone IbpA